jgi:hypothetical protein
MAGSKTETWTVKELSDALQNKTKDGKRIVVPMFQRGERWKPEQQKTFIDSLINGYPVGSMLFYEKYEDKQWIYIFVDGLQRGSCIRSYMTNPTAFFYDDSIPDEICSRILSLIGEDREENYAEVKRILTDFIKAQHSFRNIQFYKAAASVCEKFGAVSDFSVVTPMIDVLADFFREKQDLYDRIASAVMPVIVYSGPEENLPEIFERINSKGTPLDQYEIYAAAWPVNDKFQIDNREVIEYVIDKYDTLVDAGYTIHGYDREELRRDRKVNAFEYLFGLGRWLADKYEILGFGRNISADRVNPLAFELVNACLNDSDRIRSLYKNIAEIDVNGFEKALVHAVEFVRDSVSVVTRFKGNRRGGGRHFHSKYQIMSMISTSFKEMYPTGDFSAPDPSWSEKKKIISGNLVQYYVYDIITNYWSEGGTGKIHAAAKPNRYMEKISGRSWAVALDGFFERSMQCSEKTKIANPGNAEYVILNCIYLNTFTAMDQLSLDRFDVEHIAPKEQMRHLIDSCGGSGLPVSCIANLCYLPESANRSKGALNFYQDRKYLSYVDLDEVEKKYSFTESEDLDWMDAPYEKPEDFPVLRESYTEFCTRRFEKMKRLFCDALGIEYVPSSEIEPETDVPTVVKPETSAKPRRNASFYWKCVQRLAASLGEELIRVGNKHRYKTPSKDAGFSVVTSKAYDYGKRRKYWFAYRPDDSLRDCGKRYCVYGCGDESTMIVLPESLLQENLDRLRCTFADDGSVSHWHIIFLKDKSGHIVWQWSKPGMKEIDVDEYILK